MTEMGETKLIKGQAWIQGNSLVQEQLLIIPGSTAIAENVVVLIEDIWDNLMQEAGNNEYGYKTNGKKYFYWETKQTSIEDDSVEARKSMLDAYPELRNMYNENDGNTQVLYFKNAVATFSSFSAPEEVIKW